MVSSWGPGTPLLVRTTAGGLVSCTIIKYDLEGFYKVRVEEGPQKGQELIIHEDDATRDEGRSWTPARSGSINIS